MLYLIQTQAQTGREDAFKSICRDITVHANCGANTAPVGEHIPSLTAVFN